MKIKLGLLGVLVALVVICAGTILALRHHAERARQVASLNADLDSLERAYAKLVSYDAQADRDDIAANKSFARPVAAGKRRHDHAVADPNGGTRYNLQQADTEKAAVEQVQSLVILISKIHQSKYNLYASIYGDDAVGKYRNCDTAMDEAETNMITAWASAIGTIDDDLRIQINGGSGSDVDAQSRASYSESDRQQAAVARLAPKCEPLAKSLRERLKNDIASKRRLLSSL